MVAERIEAALNERGVMVRLVIRAWLSLLLTWSALAYLLAPYAFADTIMSYQMIPARWVTVAATVLPAAQLAIGVCILLGLGGRSTYVWAALLLTAYVSAQVQALARGLDISCGCFGFAASAKVGVRSIAVAALSGLMAICRAVWWNGRAP
jgi:hypothetical protein